MIRNNDENKGLLWRLPEVKSKDLGKIGPAFGIGTGCGFGVGFGLFGGLGIGFPGVQFGLGAGAGCGIGLGFGYGIGKGVAYDESRKYSNVGKLFQGLGNLPSQDRIDALVEELVINTKKFIETTSREIEKWR